MESDFKCSCPGEDEADLLVRLAALAGLEISTRFQQYDDEGKTIVWASYQGVETEMRFERRKYYFPPEELLEYLNGILRARGGDRRFVAYQTGTGWQTRQCVAWVSELERDKLIEADAEILFSPVCS